MKILIDHNEPFLLAQGGFQILIEKTSEALRQQDLEVAYLRWWDPTQTGCGHRNESGGFLTV